jgi:hypothetical protein
MSATGTSARKPEENAAGPGISWAAAFWVMLVLAAALVWWPLARIPSRFEINYNEGWNAYLQSKAAAGVPLYGAPPQFLFVGYPPLSFHLAGAVGRIAGNVLMAGRWISAGSFFAIALLIGMTVRRLTGLARSGVYAGLAFIIFVGVFEPDYIGMNDPHLLGMAFGMAGLCCLVAAGSTGWMLGLSATLFAVSLFTKQSLMAVPAAAAIWLLATSRRGLVRWLAASAAVSVALLALVFVLDGRYFLAHLAFKRSYSFENAWTGAAWGPYLVLFQTAIAVAFGWAVFGRGAMRLLVAASLVLSHAFAAWFALGDGVNRNILFEPLVWLAVALGLAAPYAARWTAGQPQRKAVMTGLLLLPLLGCGAWLLIGRVHSDYFEWERRIETEAEFARTVQAVGATPGDALCERPLVCFLAGKPQVYDAYVMQQRLQTGSLSEADLMRLLDQGRFGAVQLVLPQRNAPVDAAGRRRFPAEFLDRVRREWDLAANTADDVVYVRRGQTEPRR